MRRKKKEKERRGKKRMSRKKRDRNYTNNNEGNRDNDRYHSGNNRMELKVTEMTITMEERVFLHTLSYFLLLHLQNSLVLNEKKNIIRILKMQEENKKKMPKETPKRRKRKKNIRK